MSNKAWVRWPGVLLLFVVTAIVQTWPLALHASERTMHYPGQPGDTANFLWDLWWMKQSIVVLQSNPFHTDYLYFPQGTNLYLHALNPLNGIISIPLQLTLGNLLLSWNLLVLAFLVLSAVGMYALVRHVTGNDAAAIVSGFIFAFAPATMMHLQGGQWNISTTWPLPFFVLFLIRMRETARLRDALAAGVFGAAITYNWIEFGIDAALFLAVFIAYCSYGAWRIDDRAAIRMLWRNSAVITMVWGLVCVPLAVGAFGDAYREDFELAAGDEYWSGDLAAFLTRSPLWGAGEDPIYPVGQHLGVGSPLGTWYLGFVPLALTVIGLLATGRGRSMTLFWAAILFLFLVLSLGPYLYIDGDKSFSVAGVSFSVPLPYQIYDRIPVFGERRIPARMLVFGILALSALSGIGSAALLQRISRVRQAAVPVAALLLVALAAADYWSPPISLSTFQTPAALESIADEPGDFSVLDLPLGRATGSTAAGDNTGGYIASYYQTVHGKRTLGGYVARASRTTIAWIGQEPGFRYLACTACTEPVSGEDVEPRAIRAKFAQHGIKYAIVHKLYPDGQPVPLHPDTLAKWDAYLRDVAGMELMLDDGEVTVYRNPQVK